MKKILLSICFLVATTADSSGVYTYNNGVCTDTLNLIINNSTFSTVSITECDSYDWNRSTYTSPGTYTYSTTNLNGCDPSNLSLLQISCESALLNWYAPNATYFSVKWRITGSTSTWSVSDPNVNQTLNITSDSLDLINLFENTNYEWIVRPNGCTPTTYWFVGPPFSTTSSPLVSLQTIADICLSDSPLTLSGGLPFGGYYSIDSIIVSILYPDSIGVGTHTVSYTYTDSNMCSSTTSQNVNILPSSISYNSISSCDSYTWNGSNYTSTGIYTYLTSNGNGCDSIATLNLTINPSTTSTSTAISCDSYTWNGSTYTLTGTYTYIITNSNGCDSTSTLNLTINPSTTSTSTATSCDSYIWNGSTYTSTGTYTYLTTNSVGCDSTAYLNLIINNSTSSTVSITECDSYTWNGINYTNSGNYSYLTTNLVGCDSTAYLNLTINYNSSLHTMWVGSCDSYTWNGNTYYSSGTYVWNGINSSGCDSIVQLYLTVENSSDTTFYTNSCYNYVWRSTTYSSSGIYHDTLTNQNNCDSILTLVLTIYNSNNTYQTITECDFYTWNGVTYNQSGTYTYSTINSNGCDSTATLNLILHSTTFSYETRIECISYMWNGNVYTNSGTYTFTSSNNNACDSLATLYLTIDNGSAVFDTVTVCYGESYVVGNSIYSISGIYLDSIINSNGCLSTISTNFTVSDEIIPNINLNGSDLEVLVAGGNSPYSYLWNTSSTSSVITVVAIGTYWVIVTDVNGCFSDTVYFEVTNLSTDILGSEINNLIIYPNPSSGVIHLQIDVINILDIEIRIINSIGQIIEKNNLSNYKGEYTHKFNLSGYSKGIYLLEIETEKGIMNKKLILQ